MTTQFDSILKGIYRFEGDRLTVCLARHEDGARPAEFEARGEKPDQDCSSSLPRALAT